MHSDPGLLRTEFPMLLQKLEAHSFQINQKDRIVGNALVMCGLLSLHKKAYREALNDFVQGFLVNPASIIRLPLAVVKKRLMSRLTLILTKRR